MLTGRPIIIDRLIIEVQDEKPKYIISKGIEVYQTDSWKDMLTFIKVRLKIKE